MKQPRAAKGKGIIMALTFTQQDTIIAEVATNAYESLAIQAFIHDGVHSIRHLNEAQALKLVKLVASKVREIAASDDKIAQGIQACRERMFVRELRSRHGVQHASDPSALVAVWVEQHQRILA